MTCENCKVILAELAAIKQMLAAVAQKVSHCPRVGMKEAFDREFRREPQEVVDVQTGEPIPLRFAQQEEA